jgi:hypothetical protein
VGGKQLLSESWRLPPQVLHRMRIQQARCQSYQGLRWAQPQPPQDPDPSPAAAVSAAAVAAAAGPSAAGTSAAPAAGTSSADAPAAGQVALELVLGSTASRLARHMQPVFEAMDSGTLAALVPELAPALRGYQPPRPVRSPLAALLGGFLAAGLEELEGGRLGPALPCCCVARAAVSSLPGAASQGSDCVQKVDVLAAQHRSNQPPPPPLSAQMQARRRRRRRTRELTPSSCLPGATRPGCLAHRRPARCWLRWSRRSCSCWRCWCTTWRQCLPWLRWPGRWRAQRRRVTRWVGHLAFLSCSCAPPPYTPLLLSRRRGGRGWWYATLC